MISMVNITAWWNERKHMFEHERILSTCVLFAFAVTLGIVACSVPRGLGISDEPWYLILMRDQVAVGGSSWPLFLRWMPQNLLVIRSFTLLLIMIGNAVFAVGLYVYFKETFQLRKTVFPSLAMMAFIGTFCYGSAVNLVPHYYFLNHFLFQLVMGFALLGAGSGILWFALSGFAAGFLLFVMPTNIPIWLVVAAFIFATKKRWHGLAGFSIGIVSAVVIFFTAIQSPADFCAMLAETARESARGTVPHGLRPMLAWVVRTGYYGMTHLFFMSLLLYYFFQRKVRSAYVFSPLSIMTGLFLIAYFLIPFVTCRVRGFPSGLYPAETVAVLTGWMLLEMRHRFNTCDRWALALIGLSPFMASLGTAADFSLRGIMYMGSYFGALVFLLLFTREGIRFRVLGCCLLMLMTVGCVMNFFKPNWSTRDSLSKNIVPVSELCPGLKVSPDMAARLKAIENYIGKGKAVVANNEQFWCYIFLLGLKPLSHHCSFGNHDAVMGKIKGLREDELFFIEEKRLPFAQTFWSRLETQAGWKIVDTYAVTSAITLYRAARNR